MATTIDKNPLTAAAYSFLTSSNFKRACSNLALKSHIASRISRKVADVLALSACPNAKMLLFRKLLRSRKFCQIRSTK